MHTPDVFHYHDVGIDASHTTSFLFEVQACSDAHILLMKHPGDEDRNLIEIVIGKLFEVVYPRPMRRILYISPFFLYPSRNHFCTTLAPDLLNTIESSSVSVKGKVGLLVMT